MASPTTELIGQVPQWLQPPTKGTLNYMAFTNNLFIVSYFSNDSYVPLLFHSAVGVSLGQIAPSRKM